MDKINTVNPGDSGPIGGGKINANFIEIVKVLFGAEIWSGNESESIITQLQNLTTTNKTNLLAAINEVKSRGELIDDSLDASLFKTYSVSKLKTYFSKLNGDVANVFKVANAVANEDAVNLSQLNQAIANLLASAPETLDTLNELATALGNDPNFATTTSNALGNRLRFDINNQNLTPTQILNALTNLGINQIINEKFITLNNTIFNWAKKPSNATNDIAAGEVVSNGRISDTIHIFSAVYVSGDKNNFGTLANEFTDGSYTKVIYDEL